MKATLSMDNNASHETIGGPSFVPWALMVEGFLIVVAVVLGRALDQPPLSAFDFSIEAAVWGVAATVPMLLLLLLIRAVPWRPLVELRQVVDRQVTPLFAGWSVWDMASLALVAGVSEEMLFRGVIQDAIATIAGPLVAIVIASTVFGMLHAITPGYAVVAAVLGLWLGVVYFHTENLLAAMSAHALYDFLALVLLLRNAGRGQRLEEEPELPGSR